MPGYKPDPRDSPLEPVLLPWMAPVISNLTAVSIGRSGNLSIHRAEPIHTGAPPLTRTGVVVCLCLLLRQGCLDVALQCHDVGLIDVDELYAYMENILGKAFRMNDPGAGIQGQLWLLQWLQVELDLDHDARDLSGSLLVFRQDLMDSVASAAEFETAD